MSRIKVVGMDPSLQNWGVARATLDLDTMTFVIDDLVLTKTDTGDKATRKSIRKNCQDLGRARLLHEAMEEGAKDAVIAFVEVPVGSQSARAMASYGICVGVLASLKIPMIEVTPTEVKLAGHGKKTSTKEEMIEWAVNRYPTAPWLRYTNTFAGRLNAKGELVGAYSKGEPKADNEHLADAVAAIHAGIDTEEFSRLVSVLKGETFKALRSA